MAQNTGIDTINDDDLADEALDRTDGGELQAGSPPPFCIFTTGSFCGLG